MIASRRGSREGRVLSEVIGKVISCDSDCFVSLVFSGEVRDHAARESDILSEDITGFVAFLILSCGEILY